MALDYAIWSTYTYALDSPLLFIDPNGKAPQKWPPDWWVDNNVGNRIYGGLKVLGGTGEAFVGSIGVVAPEPITTALGTAAVLHGSDVATSGLIQM